MAKIIDALDVKGAVKAGQLETYLWVDFERDIHIMLRDAENGECVEIGIVPARSVI